MNHIRFAHATDPHDPSTRRLAIFVDGIALETLAHGVEVPFATAEGAPGIAGNYVGVDPVRWKSSARHLFLKGGGETVFDYSGKTQVMGCECGEPGCWPLICQITPTTTQVIWSDFAQPHRRAGGPHPPWSHDGLGPFVFDRRQYEAALAEIEADGAG